MRYIPDKIRVPILQYMKTAGLEELEEEQYAFYYDTEDSKGQINAVRNSIEKNKDKVLSIVNAEMNEKVKITITEDFRDIIDSNDLLGYIEEDKVINILNDDRYYEASNATIEDVAIHEYTHLATIKRGEELGYQTLDLPDWFVEGMAYYIEMKSNNEKIYEGAELEYPLSEMEDRLELEDVYGAVVFINYLTSNYGDESIDKIIIESKKNTFEEAIEKVTGDNINKICKNLYDIEY